MQSQIAVDEFSTAKSGKEQRPIVVRKPAVFTCIDKSALSWKIIPYARAVAKAFNGDVTLVHVIDPKALDSVSSDPVKWNILRREAGAFLSAIAEKYAPGERALPTRVLEGSRVEQLCAAGRPSDIIAIGRCDEEISGRFGETTRRVLNLGSGSVLMIPATVPSFATVSFERVFVPLDGSMQAESALPLAIKIGSVQDSELILVHATPEPVLTQAKPCDMTDDALVKHLRSRNERVARDYLERLRSNIGSSVRTVSTLILKGGDVRRSLAEKAAGSPRDLVVLSAHGHSGFSDVPLGSVAEFILAWSMAPVLMVRPPASAKNRRLSFAARSKGVRRPIKALQ